ncbi:MAG: L,D-transpeptidase [Caldilineaceae bacterium]
MTAGAALILLLPQPALAQSDPVDAIVPVINPALIAQSRVLFYAGAMPTLSLAPAVPFVAPQVGPLIKRSYDEDVDRRTTAWIPRSSEDVGDMSPVNMAPMIATGERWVHVDLSEQTLVAYSGSTPMRAFKISSGLPATPTVVGNFRIHAKVRSQLMEGGSEDKQNYYYLPNVEWVQYFFSDFGIHGTYWHNDFGRPKSHGCVNMTNADAAWIWEFLGPAWDGSGWQIVRDNSGSRVIVTE